MRIYIINRAARKEIYATEDNLSESVKKILDIAAQGLRYFLRDAP